MKVEDFLNKYYESKPFFGKGGGLEVDVVKVFVGPFDIYLPSNEQRKKLIPYHDLHHIVSGYTNSRIGEGEISAWELGTGCLLNPLAAFYNMCGMATGLMYSPKRVYKAFKVGRRSSNFYKIELSELMNSELEELKSQSKVAKNVTPQGGDNLIFAVYALVAATLAFTFIPIYLINKAAQKMRNKSVNSRL